MLQHSIMRSSQFVVTALGPYFRFHFDKAGGTPICIYLLYLLMLIGLLWVHQDKTNSFDLGLNFPSSWKLSEEPFFFFKWEPNSELPILMQASKYAKRTLTSDKSLQLLKSKAQSSPNGAASGFFRGDVHIHKMLLLEVGELEANLLLKGYCEIAWPRLSRTLKLEWLEIRSIDYVL